MFGKNKEKVEHEFGVEYMGGHTMYPKKTDATVKMFGDRMEISFGSIHKHMIEISYQSITGMDSQDEARITKTRILFTPLLIGLLWKKKFRYTVVEYTDVADIKQTVVIDFHRKAEKAQQVIYSKMLEVKALA
jgi:hypothetical protein